ncbi:MAG: hypothetical protein DRI87_07975 [Bacteroidetes bacterium]|nr:MAG: hypothetical protein DRI87_07975 [Bacteroidota bacterium]
MKWIIRAKIIYYPSAHLFCHFRIIHITGNNQTGNLKMNAVFTQNLQRIQNRLQPAAIYLSIYRIAECFKISAYIGHVKNAAPENKNFLLVIFFIFNTKIWHY